MALYYVISNAYKVLFKCILDVKEIYYTVYKKLKYTGWFIETVLQIIQAQ